MKSKPVSAGSGVLAGGNWIIDQVKLIDVYPQPEQLANIGSQAQGTGGAPYNVLIDLAKLGVSFPLFAAGLVGKDALDATDKKLGTKAATLLAAAQEAGLKTSVDVVSEDSDRFAKIVAPALKHVDYCIINEIEAGKTSGFKVRQPDGKLDTVALRHAAGALLQMGVRELVVVHFPEGSFVRTRKGEDRWQSSFGLPAKSIAGTAG